MSRFRYPLTRRQTIGAIAVVAVVAALVVGWQLTGDDGDESVEAVPLVRSVERQTLREELTISGELRREELSEINSPFDGRVSQVSVEDGDTISPGDVLLALDGRPAVAANGDFAFYRELDVGSDGPDVLQLERILSESGYDPGAVDRLYTEDTRAALREWQIDYGYGGATPEPVETFVVTLAEGNGYDIGDKDTAAWRIGPSVPQRSGNRGAFAPVQIDPDPELPRITVASSALTVSEGQTATVVLVADRPPVEDIQVNLEFGGDATGGDQADIDDEDVDVDYRNDPLEDTPIVWPEGATTYELTFETFTDDLTEDDEEWTVEVIAETDLGVGVNYEVGGLRTMTVTILDTSSELIPTFELFIDDDDDTVEEGGSATFTISSDIETGRDLDVNYLVTGSATEIDDYDEQDESATFTFGQGNDEDTLQIGTTQDDVIEYDETITVTLLPVDDPDNPYQLGTRTAGTVIIEDEDLPELTLRGEGVVAEGGAAVVTVVADEAPSSDVSVDYTIDGTATMGVDYNVLTGTVTLPAGRTQASIVVETLDDDVVFVPSDMIIADWPARVGTVFVDEGETVQLGQSLLNLTLPDFTIALSVNATDRSELQEGQAVTVEIEAGDFEGPGTISQLDDEATIDDAGGETYEGQVDAGVPEELAVDGANVRIEVVLREAVDALVVPRAAIFQNGTGDDVVRVVDPESGAVSEVVIVAGLQEGSFTEVVEGLNGDELVVVDVTGG